MERWQRSAMRIDNVYFFPAVVAERMHFNDKYNDNLPDLYRTKIESFRRDYADKKIRINIFLMDIVWRMKRIKVVMIHFFIKINIYKNGLSSYTF